MQRINLHLSIIVKKAELNTIVDFLYVMCRVSGVMYILSTFFYSIVDFTSVIQGWFPRVSPPDPQGSGIRSRFGKFFLRFSSFFVVFPESSRLVSSAFNNPNPKVPDYRDPLLKWVCSEACTITQTPRLP